MGDAGRKDQGAAGEDAIELTLTDCIQLLVSNGHDSEAVGDYSPGQLLAYVKSCQRLQGIQASLEMTLTSVSIGAALSEKVAAKMQDLAKTLITGERADPVDQMLRMAGRGRP